jgi:hypothetical protein
MELELDRVVTGVYYDVSLIIFETLLQDFFTYILTKCGMETDFYKNFIYLAFTVKSKS